MMSQLIRKGGCAYTFRPLQGEGKGGDGVRWPKFTHRMVAVCGSALARDSPLLSNKPTPTYKVLQPALADVMRRRSGSRSQSEAKLRVYSFEREGVRNRAQARSHI
jgi:hypothetical protein